jgi:hypothetical protein
MASTDSEKTGVTSDQSVSPIDNGQERSRRKQQKKRIFDPSEEAKKPRKEHKADPGGAISNETSPPAGYSSNPRPDVATAAAEALAGMFQDTTPTDDQVKSKAEDDLTDNQAKSKAGDKLARTNGGNPALHTLEATGVGGVSSAQSIAEGMAQVQALVKASTAEAQHQAKNRLHDMQQVQQHQQGASSSSAMASLLVGYGAQQTQLAFFNGQQQHANGGQQQLIGMNASQINGQIPGESFMQMAQQQTMARLTRKAKKEPVLGSSKYPAPPPKRRFLSAAGQISSSMSLYDIISAPPVMATHQPPLVGQAEPAKLAQMIPQSVGMLGVPHQIQ